MQLENWGQSFAITLVLILTGSMAIVLFYQSWRRQSMAKWPRAIGKVISTAVNIVEDPDGPYFQLKIVYQYEVNGRILSGNRWSFSGTKVFQTEEKAKKFLSAYPKGHKIQIFYHPEQVEKSVIKPEEPLSIALVGCIFASAFIFCLLKWITLDR